MGFRKVIVKVKEEPAAEPAPEPPVEALEPSPSIQQDEGVLMVRRCRYREGVVLSESADEQRVPTPRFEGAVARTRVALGATRNLGNFEFARIDIMVELPCNPNPRDLSETNEFASEQALLFMQRELETLHGPHPVEPAVQPQTNMSALSNG